MRTLLKLMGLLMGAVVLVLLAGGLVSGAAGLDGGVERELWDD